MSQDEHREGGNDDKLTKRQEGTSRTALFTITDNEQRGGTF